MLNKFAIICTTSLLPFKLKGDNFFDCIEDWFHDADMDLQAPRDEKTVKDSILKSVVVNPVFNIMYDDSGYKSLINKLTAFAVQMNN